MSTKIYCGIGSRETPEDILFTMTALASKLADAGWLLRSGGADGADKAFEQGADNYDGEKEIYIPWRGFNGSTSLLYYISPEAYEMAAKTHPAWHRCSAGARKMHARNMMQILGQDLDTPSDVVVCWTPNAELVGGTAQALRLAMQHNIRICNLADKTELNKVLDYIQR